MIHERPTEITERLAFYETIEPEGLTALWSVLGDIVTPEPKSPCVPFLWRFDTVRSRLLEAAEFITAKEAVRRVLILENPGLRGQSKVTTSLFAGVQLVMPGEVAPSHRHTQSALRFVLEAEGGHTTVGGERTEMVVGDFVITPNWEWHDHGNTSDAPIFWLDGLDIPLVQFLDASFAENLGEDEQPVGPARGRQSRPLRREHAAGRVREAHAHLADLQLPLGAKPRCAGTDAAHRGVGPVPRSQDALRESRRRRVGDADDRRVPATPAGRVHHDAVPFDRCDGLRSGRGERPVGRWRRDIRVEAARHLRRTELVSRAPRARRRRGALQLLRPAGAGEAGAVAGAAQQRAGVTQLLPNG